MTKVYTTILSLTLTLALAVGPAFGGIIITNAQDGPNTCVETKDTDVKIDSGIIITNLTGIIITNLTGIIITNATETTDCGIIITN